MRRNDPTLDDLDRKILALYQDDTRVPAQSIGEAVGLSAAAVQRRLKRMRETGVIEAEVARLSPRAFGYGVTCIVTVELERDGGADLARMKKRLMKSDYVQQCYFVTGEMDFVLIVLARDMEDYEVFTRDHLRDDPNIRSFTTYITLERLKVGMRTPVDFEPPR